MLALLQASADGDVSPLREMEWSNGEIMTLFHTGQHRSPSMGSVNGVHNAPIQSIVNSVCTCLHVRIRKCVQA